MTKWIRADHAQAELQAAVAAEREACARIVEAHAISRARFDADDCNPRPALASAIRARTDPDALEAVKAEARAEALREAADMARRMSLNFAEQAYDAPNPERDFGKVDGAIKVEEVILALLPADQEGDG